MCQTELISNTVSRLGRRSYAHRMEVAVPNGYRTAQLARLNRELDSLHKMIYDDWHSITAADYAVFGKQFTIMIGTVKQLYLECRHLPATAEMKREAEKLWENYSLLFELNSDIVNFGLNLPKNKQMAALMQRLSQIDKTGETATA